MENIIQQLKDNEKPFGLMSVEMQEKARAIGIRRMFDFYGHRGDWIPTCGDLFHENSTYRLRSDYAEEPEIEERLIMPAGAGLVCCSSVVGVENLLVSECVNDPDFIGFKFKDGTVAAMPIRYFIIGTKPRGYSISFDEIKANQDFMHATHVLFRRNKPASPSSRQEKP